MVNLSVDGERLPTYATKCLRTASLLSLGVYVQVGQHLPTIRLFNQCQPAEPSARYVGDVYIQHNPAVADGKLGIFQRGE